MEKSLLRPGVHSVPSAIDCFGVQMPPAQRCQEVPPMQFQIPSSEHDPTSVLELDLETEIEQLGSWTVGIPTETTEVGTIGVVLVELAHSVL